METQLFHSLLAFVILFVHTTCANELMWKRQANENGTTMNLREIFIGRCHEHLQCLQNDQYIDRPNVVNCTDVWITFLNAFKGIDPCSSSADVYDEVFIMAQPIIPINETLFWSGVFNAALNVARVSMHYRILEETLPGYMANGLQWCGDPESPDGINSVECPNGFTCRNGSYAYWLAASREFAKQAVGKISVALNGHRNPAFKNTSAFATAELPNLNTKQITMVEILVIPTITLPLEESEKCGEGSIRVLEQLLTQANLTWTCTFDPEEFRLIQCTNLKNPMDYGACNGNAKIEEYKEIAEITGAVLGAIIIILVVLVIILAWKAFKRH